MKEPLVTPTIQTRAGVPAATHWDPSLMEEVVMNQVGLSILFLSQHFRTELSAQQPKAAAGP